MTRRHSSFLVRCWRLRDGQERVEIEHIQSGERTHVPSLATALEWISARNTEGDDADTRTLTPAAGHISDRPARAVDDEL